VDIKIPTDLLGINTVLYDPTASTPKDAVVTAAVEIADTIRKSGTR